MKVLLLILNIGVTGFASGCLATRAYVDERQDLQAGEIKKATLQWQKNDLPGLQKKAEDLRKDLTDQQKSSTDAKDRLQQTEQKAKELNTGLTEQHRLLVEATRRLEAAEKKLETLERKLATTDDFISRMEVAESNQSNLDYRLNYLGKTLGVDLPQNHLPDEPARIAKIATTYFGHLQWTAARTTYTALVIRRDLNPGMALDARLKIGICSYKLGEARRARKQFQQAQRILRTNRAIDARYIRATSVLKSLLEKIREEDVQRLVEILQ